MVNQYPSGEYLTLIFEIRWVISDRDQFEKNITRLLVSHCFASGVLFDTFFFSFYSTVACPVYVFGEGLK